jgi:putative peptide zinc metalloprotease protein
MSSVHSNRWHRVAPLRPRLSTHLQLRRQQLRGETWYLMADPASGRSVRLNRAAYGIAARLDGRHTVQQLWDQALARDDDAATQDEVIDLLAQLREAALVQFDARADFDALLPHLDTIARPRGRRSLLAWRIPLGNPTPLLRRLARLQDPLFSRAALACWIVLMLLALVLLVQHAPDLWAYGRHWMASPRFVLMAALLYLPVKLVHELAHGLAVRRWGGQVRQAGVTLMLLMPVPYVDASAASSFPARHSRIVVSAAGIMTELALAAIALLLWVGLADGPVRDAAFVVLVVAGVSTLLFNGNPLQRLDGYYVLCDALGLPNLGPRSRQWWMDRLRRRLLGVPGADAMPVARGETPWLFAYAPLSWCMLQLIATLAVVWLGQMSFVLGVAAALLLGWQVLARPMWRVASQLRRAALAQHGSTRRWRRASLAGIGLVLLVAALPWPRASVVMGVVWPPDQAQLRIEEAGFVESQPARDGQPLQAGDVVLQLSSPQLESELARQAARVRALEGELLQALPGQPSGGDATRGADTRAELLAAQSALARLQQRLELLTLRARVPGRLVLAQAHDLSGQFLLRGQLFGHLLDGASPTVRVALPETRIGDLDSAESGAISVRLSTAPAVRHAAAMVRDSRAAVARLPSAALADRHGGDIVTDPSDPDGLTPREPVVVLDVQLDAQDLAQDPQRIGERAWVRFDAGHTPLALAAANTLRRAMLSRFSAAQ